MKTIKLGELCDINPKDALPDKGTLVSFIPMQRVSETGQVDATETRQSEEVTKGFSSFREGDILMAKITPCMENGKGGIAKGLCNGIGYGSTEFHVIRPTSPLVRTEWIYYYTTYPRFRKLCEQNMTGSAGQKRVPKSYLLGCPIPVPNLNTQDKVIHSLRSLRSIIELRRAQLMKLDELVKCRFVELFGDPVIDSHHLGLTSLEHYLEEIQYGTSIPPTFSEKGFCFIRATNIKGGRINMEEMKYISAEEGEKIPKCKLKGGELIIVRSGVNTGDTCIVDDCYSNQYAGYDIIIRLKNTLNPIFLNALLNSSYMEMIIKPLTRRAAQPHINAQQIKSLPIIQASIEKQNTFASFVRRIDKLRIAVQASLDKTQQLFDSLMQEYFG